MRVGSANLFGRAIRDLGTKLMKLRGALVVAVATAAALYAVFLGVLFLNQRSFIYPGTQIRVDRALPLAAGGVPFSVATAQGRVEALFLPAPTTVGRQAVVIFAHGNGEVIDYWVSALDGFRERGIGVLLAEYPGYGRSAGSPSAASILAALEGAYDHIAADPRVDPNRIFGFGQSLGGGAICLLARHRPLRALILQSTFTSLDTFASHYWAPAFLLRDHFDNLAAVRSFPGPVLVIHGRADPVIPWKQGQLLAAAAPHASLKIYDCQHLCWDPSHLPFWQDATPFLQAAGILSRN